MADTESWGYRPLALVGGVPVVVTDVSYTNEKDVVHNNTGGTSLSVREVQYCGQMRMYGHERVDIYNEEYDPIMQQFVLFSQNYNIYFEDVVFTSVYHTRRGQVSSAMVDWIADTTTFEERNT